MEHFAGVACVKNRIAHRIIAPRTAASPCVDCFRLLPKIDADAACPRRCASEPPQAPFAEAHTTPVDATRVYSRIQLTRYLNMSIENCVQRLNGLVAENRFADLGAP